MELRQGDSQGLGQLRLRSLASQPCTQLVLRLLQTAPPPPQFTRTPVERTQLIQDRSPDAEFHVRLELHFSPRIELAQCVEQAEHSGLHQVLERDVARQPAVDAPGDVAHLWQQLQQPGIAGGSLAHNSCVVARRGWPVAPRAVQLFQWCCGDGQYAEVAFHGGTLFFAVPCLGTISRVRRNFYPLISRRSEEACPRLSSATFAPRLHQMPAE